jgi:hypothetical protein
MAVTWCLAFPYCPNEPIRAEAFNIVQGFYTRHFPDTPQLVHSATKVGEPFLRAKTRNDLVHQAEQAGHDIICLIDADTLIHPDGIRHMLERCTEQDLFLGKPFLMGTNMRLPRFKLLAEPTAGTYWPRPAFSDPGAAWVIRPQTWWAAGGMDENFQAWGGEDTTFGYMLAAIGGTTENHERPAVKAEHRTNRWRADTSWEETWHREAVYRHVWQHPELATDWLSVRDQHGSVDDWITHHSINLDRRAWRPADTR